MTASTLSLDLIHEILVSVPDLSTLSAAIRVSKSHYQVFQEHPKSIIRAVLENLTGPAFPQAARLAEYDMRVHNSKNKIGDLPNEDHYHSLDWIPTSKMAKTFESRQRTVVTLRNFYSQRYKDRTSQTSRLALNEVLRFDRAMYRYWLNLELLTYEAFWPDDEDEDETSSDDGFPDDEDEDTKSTQSRAAFVAHMGLLPTDELLELLNVSVFCEETEQWVSRALTLRDGIFTIHQNVLPNPACLARSLENGYLADEIYRSTSFALNREAIEEILVSRKLKLEELAGQHATAIIKSVVGSDDACSRCDKICGVQLFGAPNSSLLSGTLSVPDKLKLLPGLLPDNRTEFHLLREHLWRGHNQHRIPEDAIFHALVDLDQAEDGSEGGKEWSKDGWYCLDCIKELYRRRFMEWWRHEKAKSGAPAQDDCWYGYNCRTMTHRAEHAKKLNHLCTPTRGEAPKQPQQANNHPQ
ncbi:hypothetical protein C8Q80DRAFT_1132958 [Daedaleopsis nitida]|nr:hypothetical protein C8Q80DRAFT_1132958 [Daedaleopsis nitida]